MAFTHAQIDALKAAIAQGVLTVEFADRKVTYRNLQEMRDTLAMMEADLASASRPRAYLAWSKKGL